MFGPIRLPNIIGVTTIVKPPASLLIESLSFPHAVQFWISKMSATRLRAGARQNRIPRTPCSFIGSLLVSGGKR
jgi:hypothetical protein